MALLLGLAPGSAWAAVAFDATADCDTGTTGTIVVPNFTTTPIPNNANRYTVVSVSYTPTTISVSSASDDGVPAGTWALLRKDTNAGNVSTELWGAKAVVNGVRSVTVTMSGTLTNIVGCGNSFSGVNQTTNTQNPTGATGNSTTPSVTVTSATGNMTTSATGNSGGNLATISGCTASKDNGSSTAGVSDDIAHCAGAATTAFNWSITSSQWATSGVDICAVGACGGAAAPPMRTLMGVGQ